MTGTWVAQIQVNGIKYYIGDYATEIEAAVAYNREARERFGEFARLNQVGEDVVPHRMRKEKPVGSRNPASKVTEAQRIEIRNSKEPTNMLLQKYPLSRSAINRIRREAVAV